MYTLFMLKRVGILKDVGHTVATISYYSEVEKSAGSIRGAGSIKLNLFLLRGLLEGGFY